MKTLSCLIPLYKSSKFIDFIVANIEAHLELDSEVIVSDRHSLDGAADVLRRRYNANPRVKIHSASDGADWVDNINGLLEAASGRYLRIVPHDDTASAASTRRLISALESFPNAVLGYGTVRACQLDGTPIPEKDQLNSRERPMSCEWSLENALSLFWNGRYAGAFKGVVRAGIVQSRGLLIKKTASLANSERAWLFGLALVGPFVFVPESIFLKRYHAGSVHASWSRSPQTIRDAVGTMEIYCDELISDPALREKAKSNLRANARCVSEWIARGTGLRPRYMPLAVE